MSDTRHLLILLVDKPTQVMNLQNFLIPSMTSENIIFTDLARTQRELDVNGLSSVVSSASTVSDVALYWAQVRDGTAVTAIIAAVLCIIASVPCAIQSFWIWTVEHRPSAFIRHTAGGTYARVLLSRRLHLHTFLEVTLTGIACVALYYWLRLPEQGPVSVAVGIPFIILEWVSAFMSCRRVFNSSVQRQSM